MGEPSYDLCVFGSLYCPLQRCYVSTIHSITWSSPR
jgi:hypothetical protein